MNAKHRCPACGDTLKDVGLLQYQCVMCDVFFDIEDLIDDDMLIAGAEEWDDDWMGEVDSDEYESNPDD